MSKYAEYSRNYMRKYVKNSPTVECEICGNGVTYKKYRQHKHVQSLKHIAASKTYYEREIPIFTMKMQEIHALYKSIVAARKEAGKSL
jgi:hypothetical protein